MARGALVAGRSPLTLVLALLGLLALWGGFALLVAPLTAQGLISVMAVPPIHVPLEIELIPVLVRTSSTLAVGFVVGIGLARGAILGSLAILVHDGLRGRPDLRADLRRLPRVAVAVFGIYGVEIALYLFLRVFAGPILGPLAVLLVLPVLGLHFLGFAPIVAAAEGVPAGVALRLGFRAARLPGGRHLTLVLLYFAVVLYAGLGAAAAAGEAAPATPSVVTWGVAILATFIHVVMLGALAYRWDAVRDRVLAEDTRRQEERRAARGRGRGTRPASARKTPSRKSSARPAAGKASSAASDTTSRKGAATRTAKGQPKDQRSRRGRRK